MENCLFCSIIDGKIPSEIVAENDFALAFRDIDPKAPTHILVIPKTHIASTLDLDTSNSKYFLAMTELAQRIVKTENIQNDGFRWVVNTGKDGGQTVFHLHLHLLGGRTLNWPPG
jgi:histidine triad (HIT) family protein